MENVDLLWTDAEDETQVLLWSVPEPAPLTAVLAWSREDAADSDLLWTDGADQTQALLWDIQEEVV